MVTGLNWLREIAAILVLLSHARPFFFVNFPELLGSAGLIEMAFYMVTGLGVSSVMIFFVLSGYLVAGSAHRARLQGAESWSWRTYLVSRLTRLWVVLVPCLLLTLACDALCRYVFMSPFYEGALTETYFSGPNGDADLSVGAFLGNLMFLQTIIVPTFGSNGPLWSISYEFWYYILFPILMIAFWPEQSARVRYASLAGAMVLAALIGPKIMLLFPVWLMGFGAWYFRESRALRYLRKNSAAATFTVGILLVTLLVSRASGQQHTLGMQFLLGLVTALAISALHHPVFDFKPGLADRLSAVSYSLYLSHFPVLALLAAATGNGRAQTLISGAPLFLVGLALAGLVAMMIYLVFERRTPLLRNAMLLQLRKS